MSWLTGMWGFRRRKRMGHRHGEVQKTRTAEWDMPSPNRKGIGIQDVKHVVKSAIKSEDYAAL
jgi:hypothetical protein